MVTKEQENAMWRLVDALNADERHGNLSGRTEDVWLEVHTVFLAERLDNMEGK